MEEASDATARAVYETNVFGALNVIRAALPRLRAQRSGRIINISSIGGFVGSPGWGIYNSTKFAVEGFSEALAKELAPLGISVIIVEPGYFRTDFLDESSLHTEATIIDDYAQTAGAMRTTAAGVNHAQPAIRLSGRSDCPHPGVADPPLRIQLGSDSYTAIANNLAFVAGEQKMWHDVSVSTDHDEITPV